MFIHTFLNDISFHIIHMNAHYTLNIIRYIRNTTIKIQKQTLEI